MPYRLNPSNTREVQKQQDGRWWRVKVHATTGEAKKHLAALQINVVDKEKS